MEFVKPTTDIAFKKLFANPKHQSMLISFLNSLLERKSDKRIVEAIVSDPNNFPLVDGDLHSIVDVRCTDELGRQYIVEVQLEDEKNFAKRCVYYSTRAIADQLKPRQDYKELVPVIFLGILNFNLFKGNDCITHFNITDNKTHTIVLELLEWHFAELPKFNKPESTITEVADRWLYLLKHAQNLESVPPLLAESEETCQAMEVLNKYTWTKKELEVYDKNIDAERMTRGVVETSHEKGKVEGKIEVAKQMLVKGADLKFIQEVTGLSAEEIAKLK